MNSIEQSSVGTYEVKKSKFISHLVPISKYKGLQNRLREEHPKARHVVYALRYLNEFDQIVENFSDDEEPKGAAGVPSLNVLRGEDLINVAVLTVRYFGGTKLGIGGMARAYANAVKEVVANSNVTLYEKMLQFQFSTTYSDIQKIEYILKKLGIIEIEREFLNDGASWSITSTQEKLNQFKRERECMR